MLFILQSVLVTFYFCEKHHDRKQLVEEKVYFSLKLTVQYKGKSEQELKEGKKPQGSCRGHKGVLAHTAFYSIQDHPGPQLAGLSHINH